ncbi:hypothetical protein PQ469_02915 [Mucilaginibacter sp. KACC 22773]|uniref:hypothetical protein n=1 Tax=Mucilaginibacter sp. KACC 22773 TaxID=3025671 RepID=UPI002365EBB7|nr:hypothetical protein [Mucilaginibacter sp. KACC 22773]WDF78955.1 hypothetical protein PQ469_02915 [Mucilaginibacter sp. KACC 22773]
MAMVSITGIGSAFAFNAPKHQVGTTYYAIQTTGNHARWTAVHPTGPGIACSTATLKLNCTITSTSSGVTSLPDDTYPAQFSKVNPSQEAYNN